jgi:molybdenum-dependent DNA-binding transcriptional regulator ModE
LKSQWKVLVPANSKKPGDMSDMMKPALLAEDLRKAFVPVITDFASGSDTYKGFRAAFTKQRYAMYGLQLAVDAEEQKLIAALAKDGKELITKPVDGSLTDAQKESNAAFRQALRDAKAASAAYKKAVAAQTAGENKVKATLTKMLDKVLKAFNKDHGLAEDFAWKEVRKSVLKLAKCKMPTAGRRNLGEKSGAAGASSSGKRAKKSE